MSGESTFGEEMYVLTDGRLLIEFADGWRSPAATSAPGLPAGLYVRADGRERGTRVLTAGLYVLADGRAVSPCHVVVL